MNSNVAPDLHRITTPLPWRPREVHAYLARLENGFMLVDGGADTEAGWAALDAGVREVAGDWREVTLHVVTHMHLDHIGLAARVRDASGAPLAMGQLDAERVTGAFRDPEGEAVYRTRTLRESGAPERFQGWAASSTAAGKPPPPSDLLLDGEGGPLPGAPGWRWLWTPGHTAGHVSLLRRDGVLVAGDAVLPNITPTLGVNPQRPDPVGDYLGALARLEHAEPQVSFGGHGPPVRPPRGRIAELRAATEAEGEAVFALLGHGPRTAWEAAAERYAGRTLPVSAELQALRETLAHLHRLAAAGRVRPEGEAAVRFRVTY